MNCELSLTLAQPYYSHHQADPVISQSVMILIFQNGLKWPRVLLIDLLHDGFAQTLAEKLVWLIKINPFGVSE